MTGAAGRIGSALRAGLGREVQRLSCLDARVVEDLAENEVACQVDLDDLDGMTDALRGMDGVIHLAAYPAEADLHDIVQVNIVGTFHLFEAARRAGVGRVVFASSNHATGLYPVSARVDPEMPVRPDSFYGVSKVAGEAVGRLYSDKFGLRVACLRIGTFAEHPIERRHLSTWVSPRDTISAFRAAMTAPDLRFAIFYVASANRDTYWDMEAGERLGFHPEDHAEDHEHEIGGVVSEYQGGPFSSAEYTLSRQREH